MPIHTPNDDRSIVKNSNNSAFEAAKINHFNQLKENESKVTTTKATPGKAKKS